MESVQVALRIRPLVESEISRGCQLCLDTVPNEPQIQVRGADRAFTYNFIFGPEHSQSYVYDSAVKGLVARLFKGKAEFSAAISLFWSFFFPYFDSISEHIIFMQYRILFHDIILGGSIHFCKAYFCRNSYGEIRFHNKYSFTNI